MKTLKHWLKATNAYQEHIANLVLLTGKAQITFAEARLLMQLAAQARGGPIVEIGTLFGSSTRVLALAKNPDVPLISVDNYSWNPLGLNRETHAKLTANLLGDLVNTANLHLVSAEKDAFFLSYRGVRPSLVFLDAHHSYEETLKDIQWARRVGAAVICGHDHSEKWPGVMKAVQENGGCARLVDTVFVLSP